MASYLSTAGRNQAADGVTIDRIRLHSGNPGAAGTDNALGAGLSAATFGTASTGVRTLSGDVAVTGLSASQSVTWFSIWLNSGTVFKGAGEITSGDLAANAAGEYTLKAGTTLTVT
jgi:hypothetical protein